MLSVYAFQRRYSAYLKKPPHLSIAQNWAKTKHHLKNFSKIKVPSILYRTKNGSKRTSFFENFSFSEECTILLLVFWMLWRFRICRLRYLSLYSRRKHVFYALLWKKFIFCKLAQMEKVKVIHFAQQIAAKSKKKRRGLRSKSHSAHAQY